MRPEDEMDAQDTQDVLNVLGDLPQWRLSRAGWAAVTVIVERLASASDAGDTAAIRAATIDLELASPLRLPKLGPRLVTPPPRRLRLIRNRLVHVFEGGPSGATPPDGVRAVTAPIAPPASRNARTGVAVTEELVIHAFAPLSGPGAPVAYQRIVRLWEACRDVLGAAEPVVDLGLPAVLPKEPPRPDLPADEPMAACRDAAGTVQAIVRRLHDTVCLSVGLGDPGTTWAECLTRWESAAAPGDDDALLGTVTIFAGTVAGPPVTSPSTARTVLAALPSVSDDYWCDDVTGLAGTALWELPPSGDDRCRNLLLLAAATDPADPVGALVWTYGGTAPTAFTSYLLNAAKVRYETWVRDASDAVLDGDPGDAESWLATMSTTVAIARDNMIGCLNALGVEREPADGPLADDFVIADTLARQLTFDVRYVRAAAHNQHPTTATRSLSTPTTAPAAPSLDVPTFGLVTALPEEFTAMRGLIDDAAPAAADGDRARYVVGTIPSAAGNHPHRVVLTMLGETGNAAAAHAVAHLIRSFGSVSQIVMVGIAAGVPAPDRPAQHVRLGDVVVGTWNVVDFDHVVDTPAGTQRRQEFPRRSAYLAAQAKMLTADEMRGERPWEPVLAALIKQLGRAFARPPDDTDVLYADDAAAEPMDHPPRRASGHRRGHPKVHEGRIGSSDRSIRNIAARDALAARHELRAIEMEGKGIGTASHADGREWFVVRGISDYADARLGNTWRKYAAAAAAAYVRALLAACRPVPPHGGSAGGWS